MNPSDALRFAGELVRDIHDRLDWYLASGFTAFTVWSEDVGGGNYLIYIGYA